MVVNTNIQDMISWRKVTVWEMINELNNPKPDKKEKKVPEKKKKVIDIDWPLGRRVTVKVLLEKDLKDIKK